ncbi:MAG TPA: hypothetical protein VIT45_05850 [Allosphingosinicella sp.]
MRRSIFSNFSGAAMRVAAALLLAAGASAVLAPPASAFCANVKRSVYFVEFAPGSDALPPNLAAAFSAHLAPDLGTGRYVDSYTILASGDLAEGAEWDSAPSEARASDRRLGERRGAALEAMIRARDLPRDDMIQVTIRDNRQVFSADELAANPALNPNVRAGIMAQIRDVPPKRKKGEPVPLC